MKTNNRKGNAIDQPRLRGRTIEQAQADYMAATDDVGLICERADYFDLWATIEVDHFVRVKEKGATVTKIMKVKVIVGHEFLADGLGIEHQDKDGFSCTAWERDLNGGCQVCGADNLAIRRGCVKAGSPPTKYNRSHVAAYAKDGSFWEAFGLGNGRGVCDQAISSRWEFRLYGTNSAWNKPALVEEGPVVA